MSRLWGLLGGLLGVAESIGRGDWGITRSTEGYWEHWERVSGGLLGTLGVTGMGTGRLLGTLGGLLGALEG